ncbi:MAG: SDR family oxidoreductase [Bacteroidales bacterium]|jgi:NAD(P)-dependent dehydrogenase (short-subunit alcohol dehydrogenase family)|nr:SDR family oxidoreductase [Bacteroidales bacterium]
MAEKEKIRPNQKQSRPGKETNLHPEPDHNPKSKGSDKLKGKVALITGGDSGIGKATAILFAREGADIAIVYLSEDEDANDTKKDVENEGQKCLLIKTDISKEINCEKAVEKTLKEYNKIDILINNAGMHWENDTIEDISTKELKKTFEINFYSCFWMSKFTVPHLKKGNTIVNTTSITAYRGSDHLMDYAATKGSILAFTRSLSQSLVKKGIRVNAVAPGPIWTPLIASSFDEEQVAKFGSDTPMGRAGQPNEVAPCFLFFACDDSSYLTGQTLHPNGGFILNG